MKTFFAILVVAFSFNASAHNLLTSKTDVFSCITTEGNMVKINLNYGEITEMDKNGNFLLDYDDGYDFRILQLESLPAQESVHIWHHEEPNVAVVIMRRVVGDHGPFKGIYRNTKGQDVNINCIR